MKSSLPIFDLLEKTHVFPCRYMFKVIGKADEAFLARVVAVYRRLGVIDGLVMLF